MERGLTSKVLVLLVVLVIIVVAGIVVAGCEKEPVETSTTGTSGEVSSTSTTGDGTTASTVPPATLTGPYAEPAYLPSQPVDLAAITNLDKVTLSEAQKQVLARQSFVAAAQSPENGPWKFWQVYETARYQGLPVLVTTDSLLNAYHGLFDTLLQRMEEAALYNQAIVMTDALYASASDQWNTATDPTIKEEARLNMAYFSVAGSLLKGAITAPDVVGAEVDAELALIEAADGPHESPILGYTEDYSQYKPRGHYTRSETLKRYFKALMWYGHTAFFINPRSPDITEEEAVSLTRRAVLVSSSLVGPAKEAWTAIYEPTSFLVGRADDLTVDDMEKVLTKVFGTAQPEPDALADAGKIAVVREELNKLPAPKILTAAAPTPGTEGREENERSFRVMGQRFIPDSYAFQQLVWGYVGEETNKREFPMGLDAMTVLGSDQAYKIEKQDFGQDKYKNWESQIKKVNGEFTARDADVWPVNLYTGWLESLQHVMAFPAEGAPDFMKSQAWARKSLNTALGSWTELRHDTILYAKQSVAAEGDGGEEPESAGYVEPYPAVYAKIAELAGTLRKSMSDYGLADSEAQNKLDTMVELAENLAAIAQKELAGEELTTIDLNVITSYGTTLEWLEQFDDSSDTGLTLSPSAEKSPLVADVHSSFISDQALEEGTGYPLVLYVAFELNGKLQVLCGASYAYYEFKVPLAQRMTDEEWITVLDSGQAPPRPAWTDEWIVGD
ncbi:MAG: hypothetical protein A2133_06950 [Actinobacteria bacterium RBG_16_64_13]|nr:MAG: hypothetical protein A2133_06950 [Actinobacteria bacterium RBG_16_64_13]